MPAPRRALAAVALAAAAALVTGCSVIDELAPANGASPATESEGITPAAEADPLEDPAFERFYQQEVSWSACEENTDHQCAFITAPLDWEDPEAGEIELALAKADATGAENVGSLLVNPGGPGGSGVDIVLEGLDYSTTEELRAAYDVIGFDPRGVARSTPIQCLSDDRLDEARSAEYDLDTEEGWAEGVQWAEEIGSACAENSPEVLYQMDTVSAAQDMDLIRELVGSEQLDYLGFSYGTYLGATYAELYPQRTGRMVLDGAVDPALSDEELTRTQAAGFEMAIEHYLQYCLENDPCPFTGSVDQAKADLTAFFESLRESPLPTNDSEGRELTESLAVSGAIVTLYADETWSTLSVALEQAMGGDGSLLLWLADISADREEDGTYGSNANFAISAVNCVDRPVVEDKEAMRAESQTLQEISPTFGPYLGYYGVICGNWPAEGDRTPAPIAAEGTDTLLVIGTEGDPATPVEMAHALHEQLADSRLITWNGEGHVAYGRSGGCVEELVDAYLIDGTVPEEDHTVCE